MDFAQFRWPCWPRWDDEEDDGDSLLIFDADRTSLDSLIKLRAELTKFSAKRYVVASFEPGQARVKAGGRFPGFRLESFVALELRRPGVKASSILRLQFGALGLECQAPSAEDNGLQQRLGMQAADPTTALPRIDVEVLVPLMDALRLHPMPDFSGGAFADSVVAVLLSRPPPEFVVADVVPELEYLEPIDEAGEPLNEPMDERATCIPRVMCVPLGKDQPIIADPPSASRLGRGAFGYVWRARDTRTLDVFAVKAIPGKDLEREREIFQYFRSKAHPYVVELLNFEHVEEVSLCGIIMRLCPGGDLRDEVARSRRAAEKASESYLPPAASKVWASQIYLGLEYLHIEVQMVLLDLKPDNVLLSTAGGAQIADFGCARLSTGLAKQPGSGGPAGTPGFIAPELLRREAYDEQADLYSFGALVWVLATGGIPDKKRPQPPGAPMKSFNDWPALLADCGMLREAVSGDWPEPFAGASTQELVLALCTENRSERLTHEGIRAHAWMTPMDLPACTADSSAISAWSHRETEKAAGQHVLSNENITPILLEI